MYAKSSEDKLFAVGGMIPDSSTKAELAWKDINSDYMRPVRRGAGRTSQNMPHVAGKYAMFGNYIDEFIFGFKLYANFICEYTRQRNYDEILHNFKGARVRKVVRHTRFYYMLLQRLRDHRNMADGVIWSAQADFLARLADWEKDEDSMWALQRAERSALLTLNVPHFTLQSDADEIRDEDSVLVFTGARSGIDSSRARLEALDERAIAYQIEIIRQNTSRLSISTSPIARSEPKHISPYEAEAPLNEETFVAESDKIAAELSHHAIRRGPSAAWIGLDWLGDSEASQLIALGPHLYNGLTGIGVFLAAHFRVTRQNSSKELALAALSLLRKNLSGRNSARLARSLGIGGAVGLGSIVYALVTMSQLLDQEELLADAHVCASLFSDELVAADKHLDVMSGSAGGILGLLRLYRASHTDDVLQRAARCGEHLLTHHRVGVAGYRSWVGQGLGSRPLNGMSHGAAGFAYALAELAAATGREEFKTAALECISFENSSFDEERSNWPNLLDKDAAPYWPAQWCHGAAGIGLARAAIAKRKTLDSKLPFVDVRKALLGIEKGGGGMVDTLCCGTMGTVEFLWEASDLLARPDLNNLASQRLATVIQAAASTSNYRLGPENTQFNLGLFRGLAGIGYTCLRQIDRSLPNLLIWE
jgi:type 2 lantibiotic biosynthesis protein LanM